MKKFIAFIVILVCIFPIGKILLNTIPNNHNKNQESSINKINSQPSSSKENENSSTPTDNFVDINKDESSENILVDVGDNEYLVAVDSASKELIINENISDSNKYIKIDFDEILPVISDIQDYKNLSIPQYISLYNKISPHIDTNMSYSELLSLASSININDFSIKDKICSGVLIIGIPASLASVMMSISQIIMNGLMAGYGDMALAGIGVAMKVTMITGMISMGIGQGVQPLLGYCVGANTWDRFKKIMKFSLIFSFLLGLILTVLCYLFTNSIVSAFLTEPSAFDYSVQFSRILLTTSTFFGVFYVLTNALQAMGAAVSSLIINLSSKKLYGI